MRRTLIEVLLESTSGNAIREALDIHGEKISTFMAQVSLRRVTEREASCDISVSLAKWGEDDTLARKAACIDFKCLGVLALQYCDDGDPPGFDHLQANLDIDTEDRFRILCDRVEVLNIRPYNLDREPDTKGS